MSAMVDILFYTIVGSAVVFIVPGLFALWLSLRPRRVPPLHRPDAGGEV